MASEAMMIPRQGMVSPQDEASSIAAEIARLSTKLQAVVQHNTDLETPSIPIHSNCYRPGNNNPPFDITVMDPSSRDMHRDGNRQHSSAPPESSQMSQNTVDFSSQASKMKRTQSATVRAVPRSNSLAENDPENITIKRLHLEGKMNWAEIAECLNKQRIAEGKLPTLTGNAVYGRFTRNARRIAAVNGEVWESDDDKERRPKKKLKAKATNGEPSKAIAPVTVTGFDPAEDVLLAEAYDEIKREIWVLVSQRIAHKGGKIHEPEMCARRYLAL